MGRRLLRAANIGALLGSILVAMPASAQRARSAAAPPRSAVAPKGAMAGPKVEAGALAYTGATIYAARGETLTDATIVIGEGKILQVGKGLAPPPGAEVRVARGMVITAGLVDPLTSVGLVEVALEPQTHDDVQAGLGVLHAGFRAADGYNPASAVVGVTRLGGITSAGVIPAGGVISGQSAWADLDGTDSESSVVKADLALHVRLDAFAMPGGGHATAILRVREAFDDARAFQKNRAAWERNQSRAFAPSRLDLEALARALDGKFPVVFHVDRAADILSALALAREFGLRAVIAGGAEGWKVTVQLAAAKVPVIVYPLAQPWSFDLLFARDDNATLLHAAGVVVGISTGETHNARKLRQEAGNAVRAGLPYDAALAAITQVPAEALGMGVRYGTLAPGKVANLVVWSGDPLELSTQVVDEVIRGRRMSLRSRQTVLFEKYRTLSR